MSKETTEVPNKFIKQAHLAACGEWKAKIEEIAPNVFHKNFEIGEWVRLTTKYGTMPAGTVVRIVSHLTSVFWVLGHNDFQDTTDNLATNYLAPSEDMFVPASRDEVESALLAEAKKRGYVKGMYYTDVDISPATYRKQIEGKLTLKCYTPRHTALGDGYGGYVYCNGTWAPQLINEMTIKEAEKKLNCIITG
jgi:hypothetical protein